MTELTLEEIWRLAKSDDYDLGEKKHTSNPLPSSDGSNRVERCRRYIEQMPDAISGSGGHDQTYSVACRCVEFGLSEGEAWDVLSWYNQTKCTPAWSERELEHKIKSAFDRARPDARFNESKSFRPTVRRNQHKGAPPATTAEDVDKQSRSTFAPLPVAREFLAAEYHENGDTLLRYYEPNWYSYASGRYSLLSAETLGTEVWRFLENAGYSPNRFRVGEVLAALKAVDGVLIQRTDEAPFWIDQRDSVTEILAVKNGLLNIRSRELAPHSPSFFSLNQSEAFFNPAASCVKWMQFLDQIFAGDTEQIRLLRQWFGLCLTQRTDFQKILLLLGPVRSGKGTIQFILERLVGPDGSASLSGNQIASRFCFSSFVTKQIACFTDLRIGSKVDLAAVTEHLLTATGGDLIPVDMKFREITHRRNKARITILSNELPAFLDTAGALAARALFLQTKVSFEGREDPGLRLKLAEELPGILNWAVGGYQDLLIHGFLPPSSTAFLRGELKTLCAPVLGWVEDCAVLEPGTEWTCHEAFNSWKEFSDQNNYPIGNERIFGRRLREALPQIERIRRRLGGTLVWRYVGIRERTKWEQSEEEQCS